MKQLKLIEFIKNNNNWEELLSNEPYFLKIKREDNYIIFNYNQIYSDFFNDIVKEARGLIIKEENFEPVCIPFLKFFNVDEPNAVQIDWKTAKVQEKIDGSLIKLWFDKEWKVSTNGCINAYNVELPNSLVYKTFGELFDKALENEDFLLDINFTYMFELVSPYNKVVIDYPNIKLYHIGTRNNITFQETEMFIGIEKPKEYAMNTEEEVKEAANKLPFSEEGYVVVDEKYNRVKIKSPAYVNAHRLVNNHCVNKQKVLELIISNDQNEFLSYFPEYKSVFDELENKLNKFKQHLQNIETIIKVYKRSLNIKEFALTIQRMFPLDTAFGFQLYKDKIQNVDEYLEKFTVEKLVERIEKI